MSATAKLIEAADLALAGDWQAAHLIAQEYEADDVANWIHAIVHRMEGDLDNARYWYAVVAASCAKTPRSKWSCARFVQRSRDV
jgi:hypothetical protein